MSFSINPAGLPTDVIHKVRYRLGELLGPLPPDSLDLFLERYLLFTIAGNSFTGAGAHHSPYPAQIAEVLEVEDQLLAAAGFEHHAGLPAFTHYAAGVDVEVFNLKNVASV